MDSQFKSVIDRWKSNSDRTEFIETVKECQKKGDWRSIVRLYGSAALAEIDFDRQEIASEALSHLGTMLSQQKGVEKNLLCVAIGDIYHIWKHEGEAAMAAYQKAFNSCRDNTICLERARRIYSNNREYGRVKALLEHEIKIEESDERRASLILELAQVHADCFHDYDQALELLDTLDGLPHDTQLAHELRGLYETSTSLEEFLQVLVEQAASNQTTNPINSANDFLQAAQIEVNRPTGMIERAISYVARATNLNPADKSARQLIKDLHREKERLLWPADEVPPSLNEDESKQDEKDKKVEEDLSGDEFDEKTAEVTSVLSREEALRLDAQLRQQMTEEAKTSGKSDHNLRVTELGNPPAESPVAPETTPVSDNSPAEESAAPVESVAAVETPEPEKDVKEQSTIAIDPNKQHDQEGDALVEEESVGEESVVDESEGYEADEESEAEEDAHGEAPALIDGSDAAEENLLPIVREAREKRDRHLIDGDLDGAIAMYEKKVKRLRRKPGEAEIMADLAKLLWKEAGEWDRAEYYYKRLKLLDSSNHDVELFYTEFYERGGEWRKLLVLLMNAASEAKDIETKRSYTRRLASLGEGPMESTKTAIDAWRAFQKECPDDEEAAAELKRLYKEEGKWSAYVEILRSEYDLLDEAEKGKKIALLEEIKTVYSEEIKIEPMLIATLQELLELDPENRAALQELREHLQSGRRYTDLAELLENQAKKAESLGDLASASEYYLEVADMWQVTLRNVSAAIPHLERVLELDPTNVAVIDRTIEVYNARRDYASVVRLKRKKAALVGKEEAAALLSDAAQLAQERLRDPQLIAEVLEEQLRLSPDDFEAMKVLKQIYDRGDNYQKQIDIRNQMIEQGVDDESTLLREIALISTNKLKDPSMAVVAWNRVLELEPKRDDAIQSLTLIYVEQRAFDKLEELYIQQGKSVELYDILEAAAGSNNDKALQCRVYAQMAEVAEKHLQDPERTIASLESLKSISSEPVEPSKRLLELYAQLDNKQEQIEQLQFLIEHDGEGERPRYLRELRDLFVEVDDPENALKTAAKLLLIDPRDSDAYQHAVDIADTPATKATLVKFIDRISSTSEKEKDLCLLNDRRVSCLLVELEEWPQAVERLEGLQKSFPRDLEIKHLLEKAYGGNGEPAKQVSILESIIEQKREEGATSEDLVNDLTRIADIERNALNQPDQALQSYLDILELVPQHLSSLSGLEEIYRARQDWVEVLNVLERKRDALPYDAKEERLGVLFAMADINVEHLQNRERALEICRDILSDAPDYQKAIELVEGLYEHEDVGYEATTLLEPYFRGTGEKEVAKDKLIRNLEVRCKWSQDPFEKIDLYDQLTQLVLDEGSAKSVEEEASSLRQAFVYSQRQAVLDPSRDETWERLDTLMHKGEDLGLSFDEGVSFYDALEKTYADITQGDVDPQVRVALTRNLAKLRISGYDHEGAIEAFKVLHEIDPYDLEAVDGLIENYKAINDTDNCVSMMAVKASLLSEPEEQAKLYLSAADLADEVLQDSEKTEQYLKEVIYLQPDRYDIHRRLNHFYEREEEWEKLSEQLRTYIELEPDIEQKEKALTQLAELQWSKLHDDERAVETYRELMLLTDGSRKTIEQVFLFDKHLEEASTDNPIRLEVVELLEPFVREQDNKNALSTVLKTRLIFTDDPFARASQLDEYSRLRELLGAPDEALVAAKEALLTVPDEAARRDRFHMLCTKQEKPEFFVETYREAIDNIQDPFLASQMLVQKATWETDHLNSIDDAIQSLERARQFDQTNLTAAKMLDRLYETTQDYSNLSRVLQSKALLETEPKDRVTSYRRLANLQEEILDQKEEAIGSWNEVLNLLPQDYEAIDALERLYEREERWVDLTEILNRKIEAQRDEQVRFNSMRKLATVYENQLEDYATAVTELQRAHQLRPNNVEVLVELRRLLHEHQQWADLDDVLQKLLTTEELQRSPEFKAELLLQQGDIRSIEMFDIEKAIPTYLRVLRFDYPEYREKAVEALERISNDDAFLDTVAEPLSTYNVANGRWENEVELTHKLANKTTEPERKSLLCQRLADLYDLHLEDSQGAFDSLLAAWNETPLNFTLYQRAKEKVTELHAEVDMAEAITNQLMQISDPRKIIELRLDLADLYENALENRIEAEQQYREVLLLDPSNDTAQRALERLLVNDERWFDVLELYEQRYQNAVARRDQDVAAEHLLQMANIQENMLNDPIATVDAYHRVLQERPSNTIARDALLRLLREQDRWAELGDFIQENFAYFDAEEKRIRKLELASILSNQLSNPMLALDHYVDLLTPGGDASLEPGTLEYESAVEAVENYLHGEDYQFDTLLRHTSGKLLLPIYERREDWQAIAETREVIARTTEAPEDILTNLFESASVYQYRLQDYDNARRLRYELLTAHPERPEFLEALCELCFNSDDWITLANFLEELLTDHPELEPQVRRKMENTLIEVNEIRLDDIPSAIQTVNRCLENEPDNEEHIATLERLLTRQQDWEELGRLFRRRADFAENDADRAMLLRKLAFLNENFLHNTAEAIDVFFEILHTNENNAAGAAAAQDLIRLLRRDERWFDLVDLLQQMQETNPNANYAFTLAEIYLNHIQNYDDAVDVLEQMLVNDPNDPDVRRQLRGIQRRLSVLDEDYSSLELRIVDMLLQHTPLTENIKRTQELLEIRVETLEDDFERAETYLKIAELSEQRPSMSERVHALTALAKAFQLRPYDKELFQRLCNLAELTETWERVPGMLLPGLRHLEEPDHQVQLLTAVAWVYRDRLKDLTSTIVALQSVIDLEPSNQDALDALEDSYRSNKQWKELTRILEIRVKEESDSIRRQQSLENLAKLNHTVTQRYPRAIENYEELRLIDPSNAEYIQSLEDLYRTTEEWQSLEDLLSEYSNQLLDPDKKVPVLTRLAEVQQTRTNNLEGAIASNLIILDVDADNEDATVALLDLFERAERWDELLDAIQKRIDHLDDPAQKLELKIKRCSVKAFKTGAYFDAIEDLSAILKDDPFCSEAQTLLRDLCLEKDSHNEALSALVDIYEASQQWSHLEALYETLLEKLDKESFREERRSLLLTLIKFHRLRESQQDVERVSSLAFQEFPTDQEVLLVYEAATQSTEAKQRRLNIVQEAVSKDNIDPYDYRLTKALLAQTYAELGENAVAIDLYKELLELDQFDPHALAALDALYVREEDYDSLVEILEREVGVVEPDRLPDIHCRLALLYELHFNEKQKALDTYADVIREYPDYHDALEGLARLYGEPEFTPQALVPLAEFYRERQEWASLADVIQGGLDTLDDADRIPLRRELIQLYLENLNQLPEAFHYLCEAIAAEPNDYVLQSQAEGLVEQVSGDSQLAQVYAGIEHEIDDPIRRVEVVSYAAAVYLYQLQDFARAEQLFETVLEIDPENQNALVGLEDVARQQQDSGKLINVLNRKAESLYDADIQIQAYSEIAKLYAEQDKLSEGIDTYRKALNIDPSNIQIMEELASFLEIEGRFDELVELLEQESRFVESPERRFQIFIRAGKCAEDSLKDANQAIRFFEEAHQIVPQDVDTMASLEQLYAESGMIDQRRQILEQLLGVELPLEAKISYMTSLGSILDESYNDSQGAIDYLRNAYDYSKQVDPTLSNQIFIHLQDLYAKNQRWEELNELFEQRLAELRPDQVDEQIEIRARRADIVARHLGDTDGAIVALNDLLQLSPNHYQTLSLLAELYKKQGDRGPQLNTLNRLVDSAKTLEEGIEALRRRAKVYEEMDQVAEAVADYVKIIELQPTDQASIDKLKEIYANFEAWEEYIKMLDFEISVSKEDKVKIERLNEGYDIAKDKLENFELMVLLLERMQEIEDNPEVIEKLIDAYISSGQLEKANKLISDAITSLTEQRKMKDVVRYYHLKGKLAEQEGNEAAALDAYREAHGIDASYLPNLLSLGELLIKKEEWDEALKIFQTLLLHQMNIQEKKDKISIYFNLGRIRVQQGDSRRAKDMFKRVLSIDRDHEAARIALENL